MESLIKFLKKTLEKFPNKYLAEILKESETEYQKKKNNHEAIFAPFLRDFNNISLRNARWNPNLVIEGVFGETFGKFSENAFQ